MLKRLQTKKQVKNKIKEKSLELRVLKLEKLVKELKKQNADKK